MTQVVALGDSFTCGQGVGVRLTPEETWVGRLAARLPGAEWTSLAAPGARIADVRACQLPAVQAADLVTVMVGLNDVARAGFDAARARIDLLAIVEVLRARQVPVLLARLHDPSGALALRWPLCRLVRTRVAQLNAVVDDAAADPGVLVLDLAAVPALREASGWAVDRVHPSVSGQVAIAGQAAEVLRSAGWLVAAAAPSPAASAAGRLARARWWVRHGLPYAVSHGRDFAVPALTAWRAPQTRATTPG